MSAAPNSSNLILLAALGVGAYLYFSRRPMAGTVPAGTAGTTAPRTPASQVSAGLNAVSSIIGNLANWTTGGSGGAPLVQGPGLDNWSTGGGAWNNPSAYTAPSSGGSGSDWSTGGGAWNNPSAYTAPGSDSYAATPGPGVDFDGFFGYALA